MACIVPICNLCGGTVAAHAETRHAAVGRRLPVTTPRGLALLNRTAGDVIAATRRDGGAKRLHFLKVPHQPEAGITRSPARQPVPYRPLNGNVATSEGRLL